MVDFEPHTINGVVVPTTASELYSFTKFFGTCQFLRGLWMDISAACVAIHMWTDANNLATTVPQRLYQNRMKLCIGFRCSEEKPVLDNLKICHTLLQLTVCPIVLLCRRPSLMLLSQLCQQVFAAILTCTHHSDNYCNMKPVLTRSLHSIFGPRALFLSFF